MAYQFVCRQLGVDCEWETTADSMDEIMTQIRDHSKQSHPIMDVVARQSVRNIGSTARS